MVSIVTFYILFGIFDIYLCGKVISQPILTRLMWRNWDFFRGTFPVLTDINSEIAKLPDSLYKSTVNIILMNSSVHMLKQSKNS